MAREIPVDAKQILGGLNYLNDLERRRASDFLDVPDKMQPFINTFVRKTHQKFISLDKAMNEVPKNSDEYTYIQNEIDNVGKSWVNLKKQIDLYKEKQNVFRDTVGKLNAGTKAENLFINTTIFGNEYEDMGIDEKGNIIFDINNDMYSLDNMPSLIEEPYPGKNYILNLAKRTREQKMNGMNFDSDGTYRELLDQINQTGPEGVIGLAHTDIAGDGTTKSFNEMWVEGLADQSLYLDEEGNKMPKDAEWMKDPENVEILANKVASWATAGMGTYYNNMGIIRPGTGKMLPEVEVGATRDAKPEALSFGSSAPAYKVLLPPVTTSKQRDKNTVADKKLNLEVNQHLVRGLTKGAVESMTETQTEYLKNRISELASSKNKKATNFIKSLPGGDYYKTLETINFWRSDKLTPAQLIKKYSK